MKITFSILLVICTLLPGCGGNPFHKVYDNVNNRNEGFKSPGERAITPTQNYEAYRKERDNLNHKPVPDQNESGEFNLKKKSPEKPKDSPQ